MLATEKFTMRVSKEDRQRFAELAKHMNRRSQSDAIRYLVHEYLKAFQQIGKIETRPQKGMKPEAKQ